HLHSSLATLRTLLIQPTPFLSLLLRPPPRPPLFPYTTLFRSGRGERALRRRTHRLPGSPAPRRAGNRHPPCCLPCRARSARRVRSEEHTSELQSPYDLVCRLLLEKKKKPPAHSPTAIPSTTCE